MTNASKLMRYVIYRNGQPVMSRKVKHLVTDISEAKALVGKLNEQFTNVSYTFEFTSSSIKS
jgi:hypothetical protein